MTRVLVTGDGYTEEHFSLMQRAGLEVLYRSDIAAEEFAELLPTIRGHVLGGSETFDAARLSAARRLRVISFVGTGVGSFVDVNAAEAAGVEVRNTPGVGTDAVAEHAVGMLLGLQRGLFVHNNGVKRGGRGPSRTDELGSARVGILGMGRIAQAVSRILRVGFETEVLYANRHRREDIEGDLGLVYVDVPALFETCSAVVILVASSPETKGMVGSALLERGPKGRLLVNVASAGLVVPEALLSALTSGAVAAAAFDGYWAEPLPEPDEDPYGLLRLPDSQFVITPHVAAKTPQSWERMVDQAVDGVIDAFRAG